MLETLTDVVFDSFDEAHAGFGGAPKFPLAAPVRLALELSRDSQSEPWPIAPRARWTRWDGTRLYDDEDGGFFRCAARADWQEAQAEKLLVTNAVLLDLYLEAGVTMGNERWLARAADVLEYVQSQLAAAPGKAGGRLPESDGARFSDANALMVSSALHASRVFEDASLRELALQSLESVLLSSYRPGDGVAHCAGGVRGLLTDQVAMANVQLDAWDLTGDIVYRMMAQELAHYAVRTMWDEGHGGFFDRAPARDDEDLGCSRARLKPFVLNCEAAEVLHRLSRTVEDPEFGRLAVATLDAMRARAAQQGPLAAHYVLARRVTFPVINFRSRHDTHIRSHRSSNIATQLRIDSIRSTSEAGSGHPTTCMSAAEIVATLFFAEMRYDPQRSEEPVQRSVRAVEGARGADPLCRVGRGGAVPARRAAEAAQDRIGPRRASDAAALVRRRRHRLARAGDLRGYRHGAQRAADRIRLPHLRPARRRRDGGRVGLGSGERGALSPAR